MANTTKKDELAAPEMASIEEVTPSEPVTKPAKKTAPKKSKPATPKSTTPKAVPAKATPAEDVVATEVKPKQKKKFDPTEDIECRSVTVGGLTLVGTKSRLEYTWANYGDVTYVQFQDLQSLFSVKSRFLTDPLFIIEDAEVVEQFASLLAPIYKSVQDKDLERFFEQPIKEFKAELQRAPKGFKNTIKTQAANMIQEGALDSIAKIKAIDEILGTEFAQLFLE